MGRQVCQSLVSLGFGLVVLGISTPARANRCEQPQQITPPTSETRIFSSPQLGFSFEIPANYRAMGRIDGGTEFLDPATFDWRQCVIRNRISTELPPRVTIEIRAVFSPDQGLETLVRQTRPWLSIYLPTYMDITLDNQPGLRYQYTSAISGQDFVNYVFRSQDGQYLITLTGPENDSVLALALSSLNFAEE